MSAIDKLIEISSDPFITKATNSKCLKLQKSEIHEDIARKLPGLVGGEANTGGDRPSGRDGFSARMMWRAAGRVVQYVYHPDQPGMWGDDFVYDFGGERRFEPGTWHRVDHRIALNTADGTGEKNGIVEAWFDGELALRRNDVRFRDIPSIHIDQFYFSTFFGGNTPDWGPARDEVVLFDGFRVSTESLRDG